jgi:opacity protein-like surface antigen
MRWWVRQRPAVAAARPEFFGTTTPGVNFVAVPILAAARGVAPNASIFARGNTDVGLALGAGAEYAFTNNITAKLEGLWVSFNGNNGVATTAIVGVTNTGAPVLATTLTGGRTVADFGVLRLGLNYKFGS